MSNQPDNPYTPPRPPAYTCPAEWGVCSAPTEYRYRKFVRWMQYLFPLFFGIIAVAVAAPLATRLFVIPFAQLPVLYGVTGGLLLLLLVEGAIGWWIFYRLAGVSVLLDDNALVYRSRAGEKRLPFDDQMVLDAGSVSYVSAWLRIRSGGQSVRLTMALEGIGHLVRSLKAALDVRGHSRGYQPDRLFRFLKTAEYGDQSWQRLAAIGLRLVPLTIVGSAVGGCLVGVRRSPAIEWYAWIPVSALWPVIGYLITEVVFVRRFARGVDKEGFFCPSRDPVWERRVYRRAIAVACALYAAVAAAVWFA